MLMKKSKRQPKLITAGFILLSLFSTNAFAGAKSALTLRASVSVMYEYEYLGSNDVKLFIVAGDVMGYSANLAKSAKALKAAANNGFVLENQTQIRSCEDAYIVLTLAASAAASGGSNAYADNQPIPSNAQVKAFTCNREALTDGAIYHNF